MLGFQNDSPMISDYLGVADVDVSQTCIVELRSSHEDFLRTIAFVLGGQNRAIYMRFGYGLGAVPGTQKQRPNRLKMPEKCPAKNCVHTTFFRRFCGIFRT